MRSRRSDGFWIVFLGLLAFAAAVSAMPAPPGGIAAVIAADTGAQRNLPVSV